MAKGHYIPKTYLRKFVDNSLKTENTWQILKCQNDNIIDVPIDNICNKKNLYLLKSFTNEKDKEFIEKTIYSSKIEQEYNYAYKILVDPTKITLDKDDKELILISILSLYYRHIDYLKESNSNVIQDIKQITNYLDERKKEKKITKENITLDFNKPQDIIQAITEANREDFAISHFEKSLSLIRSRINDSITVIKIREDFSFISSDKPFYFNNLFGIMNFCIPIDKSHLVLISPVKYYPDEINRIYYENNELCTIIEMINNEYQYRLSNKIVFAEKKPYLENFLEKRKLYELDLISDKSINFESGINKERYSY